MKERGERKGEAEGNETEEETDHSRWPSFVGIQRFGFHALRFTAPLTSSSLGQKQCNGQKQWQQQQRQQWQQLLFHLLLLRVASLCVFLNQAPGIYSTSF